MFNEKSELLYRSLYEYNPDVVYFVNELGQLIQTNDEFFKVLGYLNETEIQSIDLLLPSSQKSLYTEAFRKSVSGISQSFNIEFIHKDGQIVIMDLTLIPAKLKEGIQGIFGIAKDITKYIEAEKLNKYLANYDFLTKLPNRRLFQEELDQKLIISHTLNQKVAVMYLDLDRFKYINDTLGHTLGDKLLEQIAIRLKKNLRKDAIIARLGGDEFGILLPDFYMQQAEEQSKSIIKSFDEPFLVDNYKLFVTTSIGISIYPHDGEDSLTLMKNADSALYKAKELGKNNFQVYSSSLNAQTYKIFSLESTLRNAIELNQLELYYQPKVCSTTYKIIGAEALIRWNHPEWGLVSPNEFIPLAEETGLDNEIGNWVKRTACRQNKQWQNAGLPKIPVSINLSANRFLEQSFLPSIVTTLEETKLEAKYLEVEIIETSLLENAKSVFSVLDEIRSLGIKVALDDFGTGFSSLSTLQRFKDRIDILKIDRAFINELSELETDDSNFITNMMIQLSQQFNMEVVAEGVETSEQLHVLEDYNCNTIQGYLFSKPVPAADFEKLLRKGILTPLESSRSEEEFTNQGKDFRLVLEHPVISSMRLTQIRRKKVEIGAMEVLMEEICTRRLRFSSNIKLTVSPAIILELKTVILGEALKMVGSISQVKELKSGVYQYELEYIIKENERTKLASRLNKLNDLLQESPLNPTSGSVQVDKYAFFSKN